ncbi:MAG: murein biosynthesis integral membrane protein MurJ [Acidobacteria bacterium RIFCSPLOWO2_12_FULL_54_10]|nr:MAG: murein biosynthesis integral membrane protein MurJ [Acidobacteria bacterium RIFCSPLOWO2_12_FULL_54_10]
MPNSSAPHSSDYSSATHRRNIFLKSAAIVSASVLLSRVLGFFREWAIADQVGSNAITDAYYAAFTIPDILNYLLAGGALSITFVPVFLEYFTSKREEEGWRVFSVVLSALSVLLLFLLVLAEIFAPVFCRWLAPGFNEEQLRLVTTLTRIMLPAQAFFFIGGILTAVQYAQGRFLIPSLAPLIYNGMIIAFGMLFSSRWGIQAFSWGVLAGSLLGNCLLQVYGAAKLNARFRFSLNLRHPGFRRFSKLSLPIMLGFSFIFVDDWVIRWCGSFLVPASITWLGYGKTLMRVVVAVFGQAAGVASYPILSRLAAEKKWPEMRDSLEESLRHVILATLPVSVLMAILSRPIVFLLFSRTRLEIHDIEQTSLAMMIFLLGAVAWGVQGILGRGFYALGNTLTPTLVGTGLALVWLPVYWWLAQTYQHLGLAAASTLGIIVYAVVLLLLLYKRLGLSHSAISLYFLRTLACSMLSAIVTLVILRQLDKYISWLSMKGSFLLAAIVGCLFVALFALSAPWMGLGSWHQLRAAVTGKKG